MKGPKPLGRNPGPILSRKRLFFDKKAFFASSVNGGAFKEVAQVVPGRFVGIRKERGVIRDWFPLGPWPACSEIEPAAVLIGCDDVLRL